MLAIYYAKVPKKEKQPKSVQHDAAYRLLRHALSKEGMVEYEITISASGKPYLVGEKMPYFNLSHSGEYVMCAISDGEVGVDIQIVKANGKALSLSKRYFAVEEQDILLQYEGREQAVAFTKMWCMKESYLKYLGTGMNKSLDSCVLGSNDKIIDCGVEQNVYYHSGVIEGYCYGICTQFQEFFVLELVE